MAGLRFSIADTRADGNYAFLREKINREGVTDVIVCGGDGSVSTVTAHLLNEEVNIGIIPMGSGNGLAFAAGIPYSASGALDIILQGEAARIDGFMVNNRFCCMMCGIGADAQVAHDFAQQKTRGLNTYLKLSAKNYFRSKPFGFELQLNEESISTDAFFIVIANSNQFGNYVTIAPKASLSDGLLDIVVVKKMHKLMLPLALLRQIAGGNKLIEVGAHIPNKNIMYFRTANLSITNKGLAPIHIDGEPAPVQERIDIEITPKAFRLLQPPIAGIPVG